MRRKKAEGFTGNQDFKFPVYPGIETAPEMKDKYTSLDGGHGSPSLGVKPHAEDSLKLSPEDIQKLKYPSGESVGEYANANGLQAAVDRAISEGLQSGREDKKIPGEFEAIPEVEGKSAGLAETTLPLDASVLPAEANQNNNPSEDSLQLTPDEVATLKGLTKKVAQTSFDVIEALPIFYKRLPTLFHANDLVVHPNELVGLDEQTSVDEKERQKYRTMITIPDVSKVFSDILGYAVTISEEDIEPILNALMVAGDFEDALYLIFQNSPTNTVYGKRSGVEVAIPVEQAYFLIDRIDLEDDTLNTTINFTVGQ